MTENEIKEYIEELRHKANTLIKSGYAASGISTHFNKSADLIEELLEYKLNGSFSGVELAQLAAMQMRLRDYQEIGTIDEFKALKEKNEPIANGEWIDTQPGYNNGYYKNVRVCSNCHDYYTTEYDEMKFCPKCGSKMTET